MNLTPEQIEDIRNNGCCAVNRDWQALCDMALRAAESSPQMPMEDEEIIAMAHAIPIKPQRYPRREELIAFARAVRGER